MATYFYKSTDASAPTLNGSAGSLISVLDACLVNGYGSKGAAGWGKPYSGTNKAVYRAASGNRHYLRVRDDGTTNGYVIGYESMTGVDTGTAAFNSELFVYKSNSADTNARFWVLAASETHFFFMSDISTNTGFSGGVYRNPLYFGEINSFKSGDAYHTHLSAATDSSFSAGSYFGAFDSNGKVLARSYTQVGAAIGTSYYSGSARNAGVNTMGYGGVAYPDPISGGFLLGTILLSDASSTTRGSLKGVWNPLHLNPAAINDTFSGTGDLSGKTFMLVPVSNPGWSYYGRCAIEIG